MKKVLWFSRHTMSEAQQLALGNDVEIHQIDKSINSAYELSSEIEWADIIAIVAPINLQQQFIQAANGKPVIMAVSERVVIPQETGESLVEFHFVKWERLIKISIEKEDFNPQ